MPQPNLVPVSPTTSRIAHKSGMSGSASTSCICPLMSSFMESASCADGADMLGVKFRRGGLKRPRDHTGDSAIWGANCNCARSHCAPARSRHKKIREDDAQNAFNEDVPVKWPQVE